jgi:hypothetical protein
MSETRDAIAEALALNRRLAATLLVRKQELEAALAAAPGDERAAGLTAELEGVERDYQSALKEIQELRKLGANAGAIDARAVVASVTNRDPVLQSNEERALDAARAHIAELGAEAALGDALDDELEPATAPTARAAAPKPLSRDDADAQARSEFEAMRARRQGTPAASDPAAPPAAPKPPKKTL